APHRPGTAPAPGLRAESDVSPWHRRPQGEVPMSMRSFFKSLKSIPARRRPIRRSPPASRLRLEMLEDRCLLSFSPPVSYLSGVHSQAIATAAFNNDARLDLAVADYYGAVVSVLLGNAGGTFQPARNSAAGPSTLSLAVGDFNADGKMDVVTANGD